MKYYKSDPRIKLMAVALLGFLMLPCIVASAVYIYFDWKVGLIGLIVSIIMFFRFGSIQFACERANYPFSGDKSYIKKENVIYGDIENPETAKNLKLIPEDMGGLYVENGMAILGTIKNEYKCKVEDIKISIVADGVFGNHLLVTIASDTFAFFPKWDGEEGDVPSTQLKKVQWAKEKFDILFR